MEVIRTKEELRRCRTRWRHLLGANTDAAASTTSFFSAGKQKESGTDALEPSVGLVPTMGALHEGHGALIARARRENDFVVVSVFVNPTQFAAGEDFDRYPRTLDADVARAMELGADVVFAPTAREMYGTAQPPFSLTTFDMGAVAHQWEGTLRPTHFAGVALVVSKLFNLVEPTRAYFGEKDYQQLCVIRQLVHDLDMPLEVVGVPTVRETSGLALSSRNRYLSAEQVERATALWHALSVACTAYSSGERDAHRLEDKARSVLCAVAGKAATIDYIAVVNAQTLEPLTCIAEGDSARMLIAVHMGDIHLIDNGALTSDRQESEVGAVEMTFRDKRGDPVVDEEST